MKSMLSLRIWQLSDAEFVVKVRNTESLQQWFKQDRDLTLKDQKEFMTLEAPRLGYYGFIIEFGKVAIGICSLRVDDEKPSAEFGIAILPEHQKKGHAKEAMKQLVSIAFNEFSLNRVYSDVFVHNPALPFYIWKCGFKAYGVKEKSYFKKSAGIVDTVLIEQTR